MTDVTWASGSDLIKFNAIQVSGQSDDQVIPGTRVNASEIDRVTRKGSQPVRFNDFSGGLTRVGGIGDVKGLNRTQYAYNQGLWTHIPGALLLPYNPTIQTTLTAFDWSGVIALNLRLHTATSALGVTGLRWLSALGTVLFGDTSLTNPAIVARETLTNSILAMAPLRLNSTDYFAVATNGQTDDLKGATSVSGSSSLSWTTLVSYTNAADSIWGMQYMAGLGPTGSNIFTGSVGGVNGLYYAAGNASVPATLQPVVDTASKTIEGSLPLTTVGPVAPVSCGTVNDPNSTFQFPWSDPSNGLLSDNLYVTAGSGSGTGFTDYLNFDFSNQFALTIPPSGIIKGYQPQWEASEGSAANNWGYYSVMMMFNGTAQGLDRGDMLNEPGTSDTVAVYGATTDPFGLAKTGADLAAVSTRVQFRTLGSGTRLISVDTAGLSVTWRPPGTAISLNQGGWAVSPHSLFPNRFAYVEPASDDKTTINQPRRLVFVDCEWDAAGNRPTGTKSYPSVGGLAYIHHVVPFLGGYLLTGSNSAGPGDRVVFLSGSGTTLDYKFPGFMGSTQFKVNSLFSSGIYVVAQVVASDFSDLQYWIYDTVNNVWHTPTVLQSKTATSIALQPIPYAETTINLQQNRIYSLWPISTTNLAGRREFLPADLAQDPRQVNTTETKYASALYLQTMEMEAGYPDASNTIVRLDYQERRIGDAFSATGTVKVEIETGGDATVASPAISNTFTTGHSATPGSRGRYEVPLSGQAYQTFITRFTLDQGSGTTTSGPNGLNLLVTTAQEWAEDLRVYEFQLAPDGHSKSDILALLEEFERVKTKKNVQPLKGGSINCNASYVKVVRWQTWQGERGSPENSADQVSTPVIQFAERLGTV